MDLEVDGRMKLKVEKGRLVSSWTWNCRDDSCGICRHLFDACCSDCKLPGDDCPIVWGQCSHSFHLHCILKWIRSESDSHQQCPLCRQDWQFK
mmetsp:Transcript_4078/g.7161  ORF Transcript_4078/g.7161 Transcript_4078/m.7161 type:complete len:93 (+) Transcript_4078:37-315(+)